MPPIIGHAILGSIDVRFTPNSDRESGFPQTVMSALPSIATSIVFRHVRFRPIADSCSAAKQILIDHVFGPKQKRVRDGEVGLLRHRGQRSLTILPQRSGL